MCPAIRAVASYSVATEARTLALCVLEVGQGLVLFDHRWTGQDVGHVLLKLLHQRLHGRVVRTRIPHADGHDGVRLTPGRKVRMAESRHVGHLRAPERLPPARQLLHLPWLCLPTDDTDVHRVLRSCWCR